MRCNGNINGNLDNDTNVLNRTVWKCAVSLPGNLAGKTAGSYIYRWQTCFVTFLLPTLVNTAWLHPSLAYICFSGKARCELVSVRVQTVYRSPDFCGRLQCMRNIRYLNVYRYILRIVWSFAALDTISQQVARVGSDWRKKGPPLLAFTTHGNCFVKIGLKMALPIGCYGRIAPRSGLALKNS